MTEGTDMSSSTSRDEHPLDRALARLHETDVEYSSGRVDGLSNHGPMAAESLVGLGLEDRIEPFVDRYLRKLRPLPRALVSEPRLGDQASAPAFIARYEALLCVTPPVDWRAPLREALVQLLPGAIASAAHGWLRTAHAVRALLAKDNVVRRRELAFGLATWASSYQIVPGHPGSRPQRGLDVVRALSLVPIVDVAVRAGADLIVDQVKTVDELPGFAASIDAVDLDALPIDEAIGALASAAARLFLVNPEERFVYLHAITATSALRLVAPALDGEAMRRSLGAIFQVVAALHATHADPAVSRAAILRDERDPRDEHAIDADVAAIRRRAGESHDDHDVKIADAALREHARTRRRELLRAASVRLKIDTC